MSTELEGLDTGHPDNRVYIEREMEHEQSFEIREAATRDKTYDMAKNTGYKFHFSLAGALVICTLIVTLITFLFVARNELDGQGAIIIGSLISMWSTSLGFALSWVYGSSMSSQNKSRIMEKELSEDNR